MTGAEENWGLIGFTSSMVLFDPEKTSDNLKQDVCETVTHELAHQVSTRLISYKKNTKNKNVGKLQPIKRSQGCFFILVVPFDKVFKVD